VIAAVAAPVAQALLRHLVWGAWFSTLAFGVVFVVTRCLPRRYCRLRHLLWILVLLRLVLPPDLATPFSPWRIVGVRAAARPVAERAAPGRQEVRVERAAGSVGAAVRAPGAVPVIPVVLAGLWVVGAALAGTALARRRRHFRGIAWRAEPASDQWLLARTDHWRAVLGVRRRVRLLGSEEITAPFTLGSLAPVVVMPGRLAAAGESALTDCALAHELAHIGRWDDLVLQFQAAVSALYFFHPVAWLAFRFSREEADRACDQIAVARGGIPARTYGASLVASVGGGFLGGSADPVPALAPSLRQVVGRLEALAHCAHPVPGRVVSIVAVAALGIALLPTTRSPDRALAATTGGAAARAADSAALADPLPGSAITSRFDALQRLPSGELRRHRGVDLGAALGTPVRAAARGVVAFAGEGLGGEPEVGNVVVIGHGARVQTLYFHLESVRVADGATVAAGTVIGTVGTSGYSLGSHLHFEARRDGVPVCPSDLPAVLGVRDAAWRRGACKIRGGRRAAS